MAQRKAAPRPPHRVKTSLSIDPAVYDRAQRFKLDTRKAGNPKDLGEIVTEALDEYLKKRGA